MPKPPAMKLSDALKVLQGSDKTLPVFEAFLACGSTPLHLQTFLAAFIQQRCPQYSVKVYAGIYGDLAGNVARIAEASASVGVVLIEWQDLDPRLGIRRVAGWDWKDLPEIAADAGKKLAALEGLIVAASERKKVTVCLPTLPFPLLSSQNPATVSPLQAELELALAEMKNRLVRQKASIAVLNPVGDLGEAFDPAAELAFGFPYSLAHASYLAEKMSAVVCPLPVKKGIVTDLDMTVWKGILGDDGIQNVHWDLERHAQPYGLYQQLLHALAREGVLVAAATKNSPEMVREMFAQRRDLIVKEEDFFPLAASWRPKSEMVKDILATWNIGAESIVFIDDNAFEVEEVGRKFPGMECIQFDPSVRSVMDLWRGLRVKFARNTVREEDRIRSASIRSINRANLLASDSEDMDEFLRNLRATLTLHFSRDARDERSLELIDKTNQFNLNGTRLTDAEFREHLADENSFLLAVGYSDKFGPLGKISALLGRKESNEIVVDSWALSCRAFSRRIEFACLRALFNVYSVGRIRLCWRKTDRNSYLQEFLSSLPGTGLRDPFWVEKESFLRECPALFHDVKTHVGEEFELKI